MQVWPQPPVPETDRRLQLLDQVNTRGQQPSARPEQIRAQRRRYRRKLLFYSILQTDRSFRETNAVASFGNPATGLSTPKAHLPRRNARLRVRLVQLWFEQRDAGGSVSITLIVSRTERGNERR